MKTIVLAAALLLAACGQSPAPKAGAPAAASPAVAAATPAGPAVKITPRSETEAGRDVWVAQVTPLADAPAKLFSTVGGDPAINGEYVFLAILPDTPMDEPKVYKIGDFNSWSLESQSAGQAVVKVSRSWIDGNGDIKTADERYIVSVPPWSADELTVTPAK